MRRRAASIALGVIILAYTGFGAPQSVAAQAAQPQVVKGETRLTWQAPTPFPHGVTLKVAVKGSSHVRLFQAGHELRRNKDGIYSVSFDSPELTVRGQL